MRRTTKALARLATLAVVAGGALSAPFAIGTANATIPTSSVTNGTIGSNEDAAAQDRYPNDAIVQWTSPDANTTISLAGTGAYFVSTANQGTDAAPAGNVTVNSPTTATCAASPCVAHIGDPVAEAATAFIVDPADASSKSLTVGFNGIFITGCPSTGLDVGIPGGLTYGAGAENTAQNCVTQGQFGQTLTLSAKYLAGGVGVSTALQVNLIVAANMRTGPSTATCSQISTLQFDCTSDASGNITYTWTDNGAGSPPPNEINANFYDIITRPLSPPPGSYPPIAGPPSGGAAPTEDVNWGSGGVTPFRVDVTAGQVISPFTSPAPPGNRLAEPGDVEQGTFLVMGSCTPASGNATCDNGTPLAGITVTVTVDHGFITPNCTQGGVTSYAECSFASTPTVGAPVGNLTNSGQSATFTTGVNGTFKASFGIAKDSGFDSAGRVVIHVTVAGLPTLIPGDHSTSTVCSAGVNTVPAINGAANTQNGPVIPGCQIDGAFTTAEQPLNGGTASLAVVPALSSPNNVAILTENNSPASTTGTTNVPDVNRVVFKVMLTDQFGNLTNNSGAVVPSPNAAKLTKTGPGQLWNCGLGAFNSTDACIGGGGNGGRFTNTQQPDGTFTEVYTAVGSFTNAAAQNRYQVDTGINSAAGGPTPNSGYGAVVPSVNDGTTTVVLSWTPETTTFASFHAGTPTIATFTTGNGAAQTVTLTLNFYNQLSQPVVTFSVKPGNTVATSTAVTVAATLVDQNGNPIVIWGFPAAGDPVQLQVLRTGGNESSCVPAQNGLNGAPNLILTNTSGVGAFTFSCNAPGLSTVSMVVQGPGGVQLAQGHEAVNFTGPPPARTITEKPTVSLASHHRGQLSVTVTTHPALGHKKVNIYKIVNGLPHLIGALGTHANGVGHVTITGLRSGHVYHIRALVVNLSSRYHSVFSRTASHRVR